MSDEALGIGAASEAVESAGQEYSEESVDHVESEEVEASSDESELAEEVQEAIENGATEEEVRSMIEEFELKVNGKMVKATLDLSDKEAIKRELQKAYAMQETSQKMSELEKQMKKMDNDLLQTLQNWQRDPETALRALKIDPEQFAEQLLSRKLEEYSKSPEQKAAEERDRKLQEYERREAELKQRLEEIEAQKQHEAAVNQLRAEIQDAVGTSEFLTYNEVTEQRMADLIDYYSKKLNREVLASEVVPVLEQQIQREIELFYGDKDASVIEKKLPKSVVDKLVGKYKKPEVKAKPKAPATPSQIKPVANPASKVEVPKKKRTFEEVSRRRY